MEGDSDEEMVLGSDSEGDSEREGEGKEEEEEGISFDGGFNRDESEGIENELAVWGSREGEGDGVRTVAGDEDKGREENAETCAAKEEVLGGDCEDVEREGEEGKREREGEGD